MSRTITVRNPDHPINRLSAFLLEGARKYRAHSNADLDQMVNLRFAAMSDEEKAPLEHPKTRADKLEFLRQRDALHFKAEWERINGWPFDDCTNEAKMAQHWAKREAKMAQHWAKREENKKALLAEAEKKVRMTCMACKETKQTEAALVCDACWNFVSVDDRAELHRLQGDYEASKQPGPADVEAKAREAFYSCSTKIIQQLFERHVAARLKAEELEDEAEEAKRSDPDRISQLDADEARAVQ